MSATTIRALSFLVIASGSLLAFTQPGDPGEGKTDEGKGDGEKSALTRPVAAECMECHEDMRPVIEATFPHEPAFEEDCTLCHSPHAARYEKLLNQRERALCTACHRDSVLSFQKGEIHTPVKEGRCVACHEVHGSEHEGLLSAESNELCFSCHENLQAMTTLPRQHDPFAGGECTDCHDPHNSGHPNQLVAAANSLCALCHDTAEAELIEAHYDIPVAGTDCRSCHDPHASLESGLLLPVAHEPFGDGSCEMCHSLETATPQLIRATGRRLCDMCHQDFPRKDEPVVHKPVADGDCTSCHLPHASRNAALMPGTLQETCYSCHEDILKRKETSKSAHPTRFEDGQSCNACHRPHTSTDEHLLVSGGIRTCLPCHETERHGHPLGEDKVDPRTGTGITCVTCHDPHGTEHSYQLIGERTRGLCLECHDSSNEETRAPRRR